MTELLWWEQQANGRRRLTKPAQEIYERAQAVLAVGATGPPPETRSLAERLEAHFLDVELNGAPLDLALLRTAVGTLDAAHAAALRAMIQEGGDRPPRFEAWVSAQSDADLAAMIRQNPDWLRVPDVSARVAARKRDLMSPGDPTARATARTFLGALSNVTADAHRPVRSAPPAEIAGAFDAFRRGAATIQQEWITVRAEYPDEPLLEVGRRLYGRLQGDPKHRVLQSGVKAYLAGVLAVVPDRDGTRPVTLEEEGWPDAVAYAIVSRLFRISPAHIRALRRPTGHRPG